MWGPGGSFSSLQAKRAENARNPAREERRVSNADWQYIGRRRIASLHEGRWEEECVASMIGMYLNRWKLKPLLLQCSVAKITWLKFKLALEAPVF